MDEQIAVSTVYDILKKKILTCEFQPGELIAEKDIVEKLNTSRTPIREALKILSGEGLVKVIPKKGIQISFVSIKKMKEIYDIRGLLEPLSIKLAIAAIQPANIEYLYNLNNKMCEELNKNNLLEVFKIGVDVHLYIASLSKNETLFGILKKIRDETYRSLVYYLKQYLDECSCEERSVVLNMIGGSHIGFIEALKEKDEKKAVNYVLKDLVEMRATIFKIT